MLRNFPALFHAFRLPLLRLHVLTLVMGVALPPGSCSAVRAVVIDEAAQAAEEKEQEKAKFFTDKVLPLLQSRCFECHGDGDEIEGELNLTSRSGMLEGGESGAAIVPGDADSSNLISAVRYDSFQMPPRDKLPDAEIEILVQWVNSGAVWPGADERAVLSGRPKQEFPLQERRQAHWAWQPIADVTIPEVSDGQWARSPIDRFVLQRLEQAGLKPAVDASRRALLRRICFDLTGLPPDLQLQERVLQDARDDQQVITELVDELLQSPAFGERWGRHWLDLVRYAETLGHEFDFPLPHAWKYRDYVIRALNADVPYDQFVREHIAGDLLPNPRRNPDSGINESIIATGFWYLCEDKHAPVDVRLEEAMRIDNQLDVFGKSFLGLTIACARCHDHKFDAISTEDYYALSGFLQSSRRRLEWLDPGNQIHQRAAAIDQQRQQISAGVRAGVDEQSAAGLAERMLRVLSGQEQNPEDGSLVSLLRQPETAVVSHPLSLPARLMTAANQSDEQILKLWQADVQSAQAKRDLPPAETPASARLLADLRHGVPEGWFTWGQAFEQSGSEPAEVVQLPRAGDAIPAALTRRAEQVWSWTPQGLVSDLAAVSSASRGPHFRGALHSPEWTLDQPEVLILAAGQNARVRLVIDGYVMNEFSELLFSGIRQNINTEGKFQWIRLGGDLRRYPGHRCHLEFLDDGDGWFAVREVRLIPGGGADVPTEVSAASAAVTELQNREAAIRDWSEQVQQDPQWPAFALQLGLAGQQQQSAEAAREAWMKLAAEPLGGDPVLVMCDGTGEEERIFIRGNHRNPGEVAHRHLLTALDDGRQLNETSTSGRLELAERVLDAGNPFPARVVVNRVWMRLFGRGIVASPDNFGVLGEAPTHPELLDFMAGEFREDGWSIKRLIRRMLLSRTYAMSSEADAGVAGQDADNRLLHRARVRRLEGEALRDAMLTISGRLDRTAFGPPVPVHLTEFMQGRGRPGNSGPVDGAGRRSIYLGVNRNFLNPFMLTFDMPQPASAVVRRSQSNVPAQALILLNNEFVHEQAKVWAEELLRQTQTADDLIDRAWRQAFCRLPESGEREAVRAYAAALPAAGAEGADKALRDPAGVADICHALLNKKELLFLD